jgi:lysophospholipase L1-like esterase
MLQHRLLFVSISLNVVAGGVLAYKLATRQAPPRGTPEYRRARASLFAVLAKGGGASDVVLVGDSLTDWGEWDELLGRPVANRGIAGDTTRDVAARLDAVIGARPPATVALMIGINDLLRGDSADATAERVLAVAADIKRRAPASRVVLQSLLPVSASESGVNERVAAVNARLSASAARLGLVYADVAAAVRGPDGALDPRFTGDGVHLLGDGYRAWAAALARHL